MTWYPKGNKDKGGHDNEKRIDGIGIHTGKSGSMAGLESDTIGGYNAMMKKQREVEGECKVTSS